MDLPFFLLLSITGVCSQVPPNAPPLRLVEADTLLLILRVLVPNRIAVNPIKKPVVTAYIKTSSAIKESLSINYYVLL
jgi:hypothetical protein